MGLEPKLFSTFFPFNVFLGHQSSKPDMISQLEREEKLWMMEVQTQRGGHSGEDLAARVPLSCLCSG